MIIFVDIKVGIYQNSSIAKIPMFKTSVPQFFVLMLWRHGFFSSYNNMGDLDDVIFLSLHNSTLNNTEILFHYLNALVYSNLQLLGLMSCGNILMR